MNGYASSAFFDESANKLMGASSEYGPVLLEGCPMEHVVGHFPTGTPVFAIVHRAESPSKASAVQGPRISSTFSTVLIESTDSSFNIIIRGLMRTCMREVRFADLAQSL